MSWGDQVLATVHDEYLLDRNHTNTERSGIVLLFGMATDLIFVFIVVFPPGLIHSTSDPYSK